MSKSKIREDKTCLNCKYVVENRFCPNCGQENTDTRKTFHHLFVHFFEDLTHYENAFWRTIKNLLFKPAALTKEYLSGKRLSYLAPVRLYIFISFITFFLITLIPNEEEKTSDWNFDKNEPVKIEDLKDSIQNKIKETKKGNPIKEDDDFHWEYQSMKEIDSIQKFGKEKEKLNAVEYWITKNTIKATQNLSKKEKIEKLKESFLHNFPKVLLIYMPIFAFFLWLFHSKKRWFYFDHGIFTLHYFSFLLLIYLLLFIINKINSLIGDFTLVNFLVGIINVVGSLWMFYYLFPAHRRFYNESKMMSFFKVSILIFLNSIIIIIILLLFLLYTLINIQ